MKALVSMPIRLQTHVGEFSAAHVLVQNIDGSPVREGVLLKSLITASETDAITVRVQSSCLFSESFWATDCDCSLQLQKSLSLIASKGGLVLYFYEEGRGAGLATKFAAIRLQELHKFDTRKAYECLKLEPDARSYAAAAAVLKQVLRSAPIKLLSNNRDKEQGLRKEGVNIVERIPLICGWDIPEVRRYLLDKRKSLGHDIPEAEK
jgi:GTP cyclohydrolase II